eukprot:872107-Prorocentrum_minimum.AAC.1
MFFYFWVAKRFVQGLPFLICPFFSTGGALQRQPVRDSRGHRLLDALQVQGRRQLRDRSGDEYSLSPCAIGARRGYMLSPLARFVPAAGTFSLPFRDWCPLRDLKIDAWLEKAIAASADELTKERDCVKHLFGKGSTRPLSPC